MVLDKRSHEKGVWAVTILWIECLVWTFFVAAVGVQGTVVPDFNSGMFEPEELRWDVWYRVCEMNHSIVLIRELLHNVVRELIISNTWLSKCVHVDLSKESWRPFDLNGSKYSEDTSHRVASDEYRLGLMIPDHVSYSSHYLFLNHLPCSVPTYMNKSAIDVFVRHLISFHVHVPIFEIQPISAAEWDYNFLFLLVICYESENVVLIWDRMHDIPFSYAFGVGACFSAIPNI